MKVLKFEASWCQPCKMLSQVIGGLQDDITLPIDIIDIDENRELAMQYGIRSVPTLVIINDQGEEIKRQSGMMTESQLLGFLQ